MLYVHCLLYPTIEVEVYQGPYIYIIMSLHIRSHIEAVSYIINAGYRYRDAMLETGLQNYAENAWYRRSEKDAKRKKLKKVRRECKSDHAHHATP